MNFFFGGGKFCYVNKVITLFQNIIAHYKSVIG